MRILVLGGNSAMGRAIAANFALHHRADLILTGRDMDVLEKRAADLSLRHGVKAEAVFLDACDHASHGDFYKNLTPRPDGVILAFGRLGDQEKDQYDHGEAMKTIDANYLGAVSLLALAATDMEARRRGFIIAVSSVAGERGRASNYVYGSAKAGLTAYLSGLRNRLARSGVRVMTVLPGFVNTKMTDGLDLPGLLVSEPEAVGRSVYQAFMGGRDVVYAGWYWRCIMAVIKAIPERIFKAMSL